MLERKKKRRNSKGFMNLQMHRNKIRRELNVLSNDISSESLDEWLEKFRSDDKVDRTHNR